VQRGVQLLPKVKNIVAVASGKGGVGKSTTAVNLALALAAEGAAVGILDADIYGPSQPMMMGISGRPESQDGKTMEPMENFGVQVMSIGFLVDADNPMIWRGPMATQALEQLLRQTNWSDLDYLIVDMPPLPDATATMFFTFGSNCTPRCTACGTIFVDRFALTLSTPGTVRAALISDLRSAASWLFAG
jgi:Mrp family chromosome partitioning ATPase